MTKVTVLRQLLERGVAWHAEPRALRKLLDLNAYLVSLPAPAGAQVDARAATHGDLGRKPVFLHDDSVRSLSDLLDPKRGAKAPHPFYLSNAKERADVVQFLRSLDTGTGSALTDPFPRNR